MFMVGDESEIGTTPNGLRGRMSRTANVKASEARSPVGVDAGG